MSASHFGSYSILKAFADAADKAVPVVRNRRVSGESEGVSSEDGEIISGTGYKEYEAIAVRTTRTDNRGFESDKRMGIKRRMELVGARDAASVSVVEEFWGRTRSGCDSAAAAAFRAACRRRCGSNSCSAAGAGVA